MNEIIDLQDGLQRVQDDKELLLELFEIFTEDFEIKRQTLRQSLETKNLVDFRMMAHALKGATANISAKQMNIICVELDHMGKEGVLEGAGALVDRLEAAFDIFKAEVVKVKDLFATTK